MLSVSQRKHWGMFGNVGSGSGIAGASIGWDCSLAVTALFIAVLTSDCCLVESSDFSWARTCLVPGNEYTCWVFNDVISRPKIVKMRDRLGGLD